MYNEETVQVPRSSTPVTGILLMVTVGGVAFYAGFRPTFFLTILGAILLALSVMSPLLFLISLRAEQLSWKVSLTIVAILVAVLIMMLFVPSWYLFTYLPRASDPLMPAIQ